MPGRADRRRPIEVRPAASASRIAATLQAGPPEYYSGGPALVVGGVATGLGGERGSAPARTVGRSPRPPATIPALRPPVRGYRTMAVVTNPLGAGSRPTTPATGSPPRRPVRPAMPGRRRDPAPHWHPCGGGSAHRAGSTRGDALPVPDVSSSRCPPPRRIAPPWPAATPTGDASRPLAAAGCRTRPRPGPSTPAPARADRATPPPTRWSRPARRA